MIGRRSPDFACLLAPSEISSDATHAPRCEVRYFGCREKLPVLPQSLTSCFVGFASCFGPAATAVFYTKQIMRLYRCNTSAVL